MLTLIVCLVLAAIVLGSALLQRTYNAVPRHELKRQAKEGHQLAAVLYKAVTYEASLRLLLWIIIGLASTELFILISHAASNGFAFISILVFLWLAYVWVPQGALGPTGVRVAEWFTPVLVWLLDRLHPFFDKFNKFIAKHRHITVHTGLYEKSDLLNLIKRQKKQADSRMSEVELDIAAHALTFGDKVVRDVLIPRKVVKTVKVSDDVGPVLMDELHKSGFSRFPVTEEGKGGAIIGTLYLRDLVDIKTGCKVKDVMSKDVYYANENASLYSVFQAFLKTKHHLYVVVNEFEEMSGIITIEDVLEQILGKPLVDEFDKYDDMRAVASSLAEKEKHEHASEVVE
jgi:CBS domain containing-hemolysin-like protein